MKNSTWLMLLPVTVACAVAGVFYVLFPERIMAGGTMLSSVALVSLASGAIVYSPLAGGGRSSDAGVLGTLGIGTIMSLLVFLSAATGVGLAIAGIEKGAMALNIVTIAGFVAAFVVVRATSGSISGIAAKHETRSGQVVWAERLERIGRGCGMPQLQTRLLKLAGESRFLARDQGMATAEINQRIAGVLDTIAEAVRRNDEQVATMQLKRLRNLFAERESELLNLRSKI